MSSGPCHSDEGFLESVRYLLGRQRGDGVLGLRPRYSSQDLQGNGRCVQKHVQNHGLEFKPDFSHVLPGPRQAPSLFCLMFKQGEQLLRQSVYIVIATTKRQPCKLNPKHSCFKKVRFKSNPKMAFA